MSRAQGNPGWWHTYPDRQHWPEDEREEAEHAQYVHSMLAPYAQYGLRVKVPIPDSLRRVRDFIQQKAQADRLERNVLVAELYDDLLAIGCIPRSDCSGNDYPLACTD